MMKIRFYSTKPHLLKTRKNVLVPPPLPFKSLNPRRSPTSSSTPTSSSASSPQNRKIEAFKLSKSKEREIDIGKNHKTIEISDVTYTPIPSPTPPDVATLEHNLDRVLFSPGVHFLQDPRTRVFNFTPFLKKIMPVTKFDFNCISQYITASKDKILLEIAEKMNLRYYSSTSSMTSLLSQFHFWLSNDRPANITNLSKHFHGLGTTFTSGTRCPTVLMCKNNGDNIYSIDSDKSADKEILLSLLGHSMEKLLTTSPEIFNKYHIENSHELSLEEINKPESYHYAKIGDFLMRSQLDCYDQRLPGTGTFDLKTRAVCAVRHDIEHAEKHLTGYKIFKNNGLYESFEREFFELIRSALLKYSLQARIGNMDGIFVCYHNIENIFGFQYLSLQDIDTIFHSYDDDLSYRDSNNIKPIGKLDVEKIQGPIGEDLEDLQVQMSSYIAESEFRVSIKIWSDLLKTITKSLNNKSFRLVISSDPVDKLLNCLATPIESDKIDEIQKLGERNTKEEVTESSSEDKFTKHRLEFQKINKETSDACIGFKITRKHYFNDKESNQVYYKPRSTNDKWEIKYQISSIPKKKSVQLYLKYLKEKEKIVWGDKKDDMNEQIDEYLKILRAYGDKGKLREEIWKEKDEKLTVWNPIQNDKNV